MSAQAQVDPVWPVRPCTPWCDHRVNNGHANEHPDDRHCWSPYERVVLSKHPALEMGDKEWWQSYLNVYLRRAPGEDETVIYIHSEETDKELILSLDEAHALAATLTDLANLAERPA